MNQLLKLLVSEYGLFNSFHQIQNYFTVVLCEKDIFLLRDLKENLCLFRCWKDFRQKYDYNQLHDRTID